MGEEGKVLCQGQALLDKTLFAEQTFGQFLELLEEWQVQKVKRKPYWLLNYTVVLDENIWDCGLTIHDQRVLVLDAVGDVLPFAFRSLYYIRIVPAFRFLMI